TLLPLAIAVATGPVSDALRPTRTSARTHVSAALEGTAIPLSCTLPFDPIKQLHPIDDSCSADGSAQEGTAQAAQNEAKNNFCQAGTPAVLKFDDFESLQGAAEAANVAFGSGLHLPTDRSVLTSLISVQGGGTVGEGTVVRLSAYVIDAHY